MIWIRVDGNSEIGMGHIMRCISIADEIQRMGGDVCFIIADEDVVEVLNKKKQQYLVLHTEYNFMENELEVLKELLYEYKPDLLLVDSYSVTKKYFEQLSQIIKVAYMDDLGMFVYPVDMLINYNIYAAKEMYEQYAGDKCRFLLGGQYAPLRKEFQREVTKIRENVEHVFISTGGSDKYNLTGTMLDYIIRDEAIGKLNYHVICGKFNVHVEELEQKARNCTNINIYRDVTDMADVMLQCDLAVSAAGSTLYELAALNIPSIIFSFVDNQKKAVCAFADRGAAVSLGHYKYTCEVEFMNSVVETLKILCEDYKKRQSLADTAKCLVDGQGAKRIATAIMESCYK